MTEKPILFKPHLIKAILDGRKWQTRRLITKFVAPSRKERGYPKISEFGRSNTKGYDFHFRDDRTSCWNDVKEDWVLERCPYGVAGGILWVKESFLKIVPDHFQCCPYGYRGDYTEKEAKEIHGWTSALFMPRDVCRLELPLKSVRIERLRDISPEDALAEGIEMRGWSQDAPFNAVNDFRKLWDSINGKKPGASWIDNPWNWVLEWDPKGEK